MPYQEAAERYPEIPIEEFRRAVQYIDGMGRRWSGAPAIFQSVKNVSGYGWLSWAYLNVPLFAPVSDWIYREVAGHRKTATWVTRLLWGASLDFPQYQTSVWLFRRVLAVLYAIAFVSFGVQVKGLIGAQGILPVTEYLDAVKAEGGARWFLDAPTIFWWWHGDEALEWVCWVGAGLAVICALGVLQRPILAALYVLYLSLVTAGQVFMGYQWDFLLLECGFLAIFLTPSLPRVWLCQWLLFRLMFESGCVKLLSHDPTWANLTALSFHYQTQPLPTPLAWYAGQLPMSIQKFSTAMVFVIELGLPFLVFGPRRLKQVAAMGFVLLQVLIMSTGNYTCFNLLAMALSLSLLDDQFWGHWGASRRSSVVTEGNRGSRILSAVLTAFILLVSGTELINMFRDSALPAAARGFVARLSPFGIINTYGLFASMTTTRIEIEIQGSLDGENWKTYTFRYKPGDPNRAPPWVEPHQPRLDWQMWFAALSNYRENPWFSSLMVRLLTATPDVLQLFENVPFGENRPKFVRALAYEYQFSDIHVKETSHAWWVRRPKGLYFPSASLRNP